MIATFLLHLFAFFIPMWGGERLLRFPDKPDAVGAGANQGQPDGEPVERRMVVHFINEIGPEEPSSPARFLLQELLRSPAALDVTGPDALPLPPLLVDESGVAVESTEAEMIARAKLAGIYESQVKARIERAWTLPESTDALTAVTCRALIRQHRDGRVKEVELPYDGCDASAEVRQSLISAIFTASPLPAPPHPGVFVDSFSLILKSQSIGRR